MADLMDWSKVDKGQSIKCIEGNVLKGCNINENTGGSLIRTNLPINNASRFYFEINILEGNGQVAFGLTKSSIRSDSFPEWSSGINYRHSLYKNNGRIYHGGLILVEETEAFGSGDTVGCLIKSFDVHNEVLYKGQYIKNGKAVGLPWHLKNDDYFPTVAIKNGEITVKTNFGESDFVFKGNRL